MNKPDPTTCSIDSISVVVKPTIITERIKYRQTLRYFR